MPVLCGSSNSTTRLSIRHLHCGFTLWLQAFGIFCSLPHETILLTPGYLSMWPSHVSGPELRNLPFLGLGFNAWAGRIPQDTMPGALASHACSLPGLGGQRPTAIHSGMLGQVSGRGGAWWLGHTRITDRFMRAMTGNFRRC